MNYCDIVRFFVSKLRCKNVPSRSLTPKPELLSFTFLLPEITVQCFGFCTSRRKCRESSETEYSSDKLDLTHVCYIMNIKPGRTIATKITKSDVSDGYTVSMLYCYLHISLPPSDFHPDILHFLCFVLYY